jgi:hypothetical protein
MNFLIDLTSNIIIISSSNFSFILKQSRLQCSALPEHLLETASLYLSAVSKELFEDRLGSIIVDVIGAKDALALRIAFVNGGLV